MQFYVPSKFSAEKHKDQTNIYKSGQGLMDHYPKADLKAIDNAGYRVRRDDRPQNLPQDHLASIRAGTIRLLTPDGKDPNGKQSATIAQLCNEIEALKAQIERKDQRIFALESRLAQHILKPPANESNKTAPVGWLTPKEYAEKRGKSASWAYWLKGLDKVRYKQDYPGAPIKIYDQPPGKAYAFKAENEAL